MVAFFYGSHGFFKTVVVVPGSGFNSNINTPLYMPDKYRFLPMASGVKGFSAATVIHLTDI